MHARVFRPWRPGECDAALRLNTVLIGVYVWQSDPKVKAGKEGAFKESVEWFHKYL